MTDVFRKKYVELSKEKQADLDNLKGMAQTMHELIESRPCRESSIAKTKLEECIMWAVKGITNY